MTNLPLISKLRVLREQACSEGIPNIGSHQLDAHLSIAYACEQPPEPWEIYRVPSLYAMPSTDFYTRHAGEIQEAIRPTATWELLREHAVPKLELEAGMSEEDCRRHSYPGKVQYYDGAIKAWATVDVPRIRWFDSRDLIREIISETKDELVAKIAKVLQRHKDAATKDPSPQKLETLARYEKYVREMVPERLEAFDRKKAADRSWLDRLDRTPDFAKAIFAIVRAAENEVRKSQAIPLIGESWVSETELLYRVRQLVPDVEVVAHGQPKWLGRQHLDIWIPTLNVALEYHGVQHYRAVDFFGGEEAFRKGQDRDRRKRELCQRNDLRLIEVAYDQNLDDLALLAVLKGG